MNYIRGALIALLVAGLTLFSVANSEFVVIDLGFQRFNVWLPLLVLLSFALGFLPVWLRLSADRMLLKRKVTKLEAALGRTETDLAQAKVELLRPPAATPAPSPPLQQQSVPHPAPPPGT
jgi:uncharacterized integral membrane protein